MTAQSKEVRAAVRWMRFQLKERPCPQKWRDLVEYWFPIAFLAGVNWQKKEAKTK